MARILEGTYSDTGGRFAIVAARFNDFIVAPLVSGAEDALRRHGVDTDTRLDIAWVPGAVELPIVCHKLAKSGKYDAVIALGAVIRGSTSHYDHVCAIAARGVADAASDTGVPVIFGLLTTDTLEQAIERAGTKAGNNGAKAAMSALEMANLFKVLE